MKNTRLLILTALIIAALFAAVLPAFAGADPFSSAINASFEFDTNNDGTPNSWNKHGDILHVCGRPSNHMIDNCLMAFLPSDERAILYQVYENGLPSTTSEGWPTLIMDQYSLRRISLRTAFSAGGVLAGKTMITA